MVWYVMKGDALKFKRSAHFEHWHFNCTMNRPTVMSFHYRHHFNIFLKTLLKMYFIFWKCVQEQQGFPLLIYATATAKSLQLCPTLCDHIDGSPPGSPIPGILQARTLEWVAISSSNAWKWKVKSEREVAQLCPTLRDPMDCSPPGSSVHGILQTRVLEWGAIAFSLAIPFSPDDNRFLKRVFKTHTP